jgi:hypothetical protein
VDAGGESVVPAIIKETELQFLQLAMPALPCKIVIHLPPMAACDPTRLVLPTLVPYGIHRPGKQWQWAVWIQESHLPVAQPSLEEDKAGHRRVSELAAVGYREIVRRAQ